MKDLTLRPLWVPSILALLLPGCADDIRGLIPTGSSTTFSGSTTTTSGPDSTSTGAASSSSGVADSSGSSTGSSTGDTESTGTTGPGIIDPGCPECTVLADGLMGGRGLNLHGGFVYFTDQAAGTINRVPMDGGEVELLHELQAEPFDVIANDDYVFWTTFIAGGSVWRANLPSGPPIPLSADEFPRMLQLEGDYVYWCAFDETEGRVRRVTITGIGNPPETLVSAGAGVADLVLDQNLVYFTTHDPPDMPGLAPPGAVYVAAADMPTDIIDLQALALNQAEPWGIAVSGNTVFWVNGVGNPPDLPKRVLSVSTMGENLDILVSSQTAPWGVAADEDWVYYTDYTEVKALPHIGGDPVLLAQMQNIARNIVDDEDDLYWITRDRLLRRPKP